MMRWSGFERQTSRDSRRTPMTPSLWWRRSDSRRWDRSVPLSASYSVLLAGSWERWRLSSLGVSGRTILRPLRSSQCHRGCGMRSTELDLG